MPAFNNPHVYVISVVAAYWLISIGMVYVNKILISSERYSISAPIFVTWFQCLATVFILFLAGEIGEKTRKSHAYNQVGLEGDDGSGKDSSTSFLAQFPRADFKQNVAKRVFPLSLVFAGMVMFNNLCLKHVQVSFYIVARSLTIVFNAMLSHIIIGVPTSARTIACLGIVVLGFVIGSKGEIDLSLMGTFFGICSSVCVSLNSIYTKKTLPAVDDDHWRLTFYNNGNACILFLPIILVFESGTIFAAIGKQLSSPVWWMSMVVSGVFGFSIGIITVLQIKATSPLTHNISGTAKAAVQSMVAYAIWKNKATFLGILGIFTVLGGSLAYTFVKISEGNKIASSLVTASSNREDIEMQSGSKK